MDGDVVEEDFGGFGGDAGEGEGGDGPEIGAGEEALEVGGGEGDSVVFEDFGEEEEEGSREGFVGWLEAGGADGERREFWRYRNHFSGPPGFEAPAGRLRVRAVCVIAACRLRNGGKLRWFYRRRWQLRFSRPSFRPQASTRRWFRLP